MKMIEEYARQGESHDVMDALILLTQAYISQCGISLGNRTIVYCAGEAWLERLAWLDFPLSEMAREGLLVEVMPYITSEYDPEIYDEYDIPGMSKTELLEGCRQIMKDNIFNEATMEVLCWGIKKVTEEKVDLSLEIEAVAPDGTCIKGVLTEQRCIRTSLTMTSPFKNVDIMEFRLVRDAKKLLIEGYYECQQLLSQEQDIRALYSKYQEELRKREHESKFKKSCAFDDIYGPLIGYSYDTVLIFSREKLIHDWFGLEIYDQFAK